MAVDTPKAGFGQELYPLRSYLALDRHLPAIPKDLP
jgi:hypothetical protein